MLRLTICGPNFGCKDRQAMARVFNGTTSLVTIAADTALDNLNTFTYTAWIYPTGNGEGNLARILQKNTNTAGKRWQVNNSAAPLASLHLVIDRATTDAIARSVADTIQFNVWQFVAASWNGVNAAKLYVGTNGGQVGEVSYNTTPSAGSGATENDSANPFYVGATNNGGNTFDGSISDVRIYDRVLSLDELNLVMQGKQVYKPLCWWLMDGWGITELDLSGNGHHGTASLSTRTKQPATLTMGSRKRDWRGRKRPWQQKTRG